MNIFIEKEKNNIIIKFNGSVKKLLKSLDINPEVVLVVRNNALLADNDSLSDKDDIKILSVVSGG
jgi:sulfur carrier protein ThiS